MWSIVLILILLEGTGFGQTLAGLDFEGDETGKPPLGWSAQDEEKMARTYTVQSEEGNKFLRADSRGNSVQIGYEKKWALKDYPILRWRWRAQIFPEGSDERKKSGNDNILAVYVVFGGWPVPRSIKYVWSDTLPAGTKIDSPHSGKTKIIVVRSGRSAAGKWITEERNVLTDYRSVFGDGEADPEARGIALLTDSDNTKTRAVGDYDDIVILGKSGE